MSIYLTLFLTPDTHFLYDLFEVFYVSVFNGHYMLAINYRTNFDGSDLVYKWIVLLYVIVNNWFTTAEKSVFKSAPMYFL